MTLLYYSPVFLEHRTGAHPESPARLENIVAHLRERGFLDRCPQPQWQPAPKPLIMRIHGGEYLDLVAEFARQGGGRIEVDTTVSTRSYEAACLAAGAVCDAVRRVIAGESQNALCLVRPPGHHALAAAPMGFCLINHVAVAAALALEELDLDRVMIIDFDVHHGNGTQDTFWETERVGFLSIHRWPFYPGTGAADETGSGAGLGYTCNLPVTYGTAVSEFHKAFRVRLESFADKVRPQLVLISAGFDAHRLDPVGSLGLESEDYSELTKCVQQIASTHASGLIVSTLEGGYNLSVLPLCVEQHLQTLIDVNA
jgi:acetoin utilization deacetylase AcuC-like enzyme